MHVTCNGSDNLPCVHWIVRVPAQGLTEAELMGELAVIQACSLSISPPIFGGGLATTRVCQQLNRYDIMRLRGKRIGTTL